MRGTSPTGHRRLPTRPAASPAAPAAHAAGAIPVGVSAAADSPVGASAARSRSASSAAPAATFSCDCGVVMTGTRNCSDSRWVTSGMPAPPPTVATAAMFEAATLLRSNVSPRVARRPASGAAMRLSSSVRVRRTSDRKPGRSTGTTVAVSAERRSLACLLSSRRRVSDPTAAVPAGSALLASAIPVIT